MKKIIGMLLLCCVFLYSCSNTPFDFEASKQKVLDMGYMIQNECKTEAEIAEIEKSILSTMKFDGYDTEGLDLQITYYVRYTIYIKDDFNSVYEAVDFVTFETDKAAKYYYDYSIRSRSKDSEWKSQIRGNITIDTNNSDVMKAIGGTFK